MSKNVLFVFVCALCALTLGCQTQPAPNATVNANSGANVMTNIDPKNMPPGLSSSPLPPSTNTTPGIPDPKTMNANILPKGATPTPGIPDPKNAGKPLPKGATPTPGIPDPETLKKQMNRPANINDVNNPPANAAATNSTDGPRTDRKP